MALKTSNPDDIFNEIVDNMKGFDIDVLKSAYAFAKNAHKDQTRASGDPYITHPLFVAKYLSEIGMDNETIVSALLHDVVEDTDIKLSKIKKEFGKEVALIVDGVTKLDKINYSSTEEAQAESIRKMVIAMSKDVRVLILKLADRLHNIQTIEPLPEWKQNKIAAETLYVYSPLAHRLGLQSIKHILEDNSF